MDTMVKLAAISFAAVCLLKGAEASGGCTVSNIECYEDSPDHRVLPTQALDGGMTQEYCAQLCSDKKMAYAGVEFSSQCFCGNSVPTTAKKSTNCNMACSADKNKMCGGNDAIGIFKVDCSGAPVTPPPTPIPPPYMVNPCIEETYKPMPFCNTSMPIMDRVEDAIGRMTLAEKISNLVSGAGGVKGLGLINYNWWSEATHGISHNRNDAKTPV